MQKIKDIFNNYLQPLILCGFLCYLLYIIPHAFFNFSVELFISLMFYIGIILYIFFLVYDVQKFKVEKFFIVSYIILGFLYLLLFTPLSTPDAAAHFLASYRYSNILVHNLEWVGRFDDVNFYHMLMDGEVDGNNFNHNYGKLFENINFFADNSDIVNFRHQENRMKFYSFFCYIPQIFGFLIGRIFNLSAILTCYASRMATYLIYLFLYLRAIKLMPFQKNVIAFIGLLPISLMISSSFNYDVMVMLVTMNFIAVVFNLYAHDKKTSLWECAIWSFLLGTVKGGGYIILLPLVFILWDKTDKRKNIGILGVIFTGLMSIYYFDVYLTKDMQFFQLHALKENNLSAKFAFEHPIEYLKMYIRAIYEEGNIILFSMIGSFLSHMRHVVSEWISGGLLIVIIACSLFEQFNIRLSRKDSLLIWAIIIIFILTMPIMLLSYTPASDNHIRGIQGRYYLPILPLLLIVLSANKGKFRNSYSQKFGDIIAQKGYVIYAFLSVLAVISIFNLYMNR